MVCEVKQIESALSAAYVVAEEQKPIGKAEFPVNFLFGMPCDISYRDESYHLKYLAMASKEYRENNITLKNIVPYLIKHGEEVYGTLYGKRSDGFFLTRYGFDCLELSTGTVYDMYEVGLGKAGIVYPIYRDGVQVAEIHKGCVVHNNLDEYTVYAVDQEAQRNAVLLCVYLDGRGFARRGEMTKNYTERVYYKTTNKQLCAKYDPTFRKRAAQITTE